MLAPSELDQRLDLARHLAREAAALILTHYSPLGSRFDTKPDGSPVTIADKGAEELLRARLQRLCPSDAILGEEFGESPGSSGLRWILDPIDGTRSFVCGVPLFGTMIGLEDLHAAQPAQRFLAGVVRFPALHEEASARLGSGAFFAASGRPPAPARVSTIASLDAAILCTTDPRTFSERLGTARAAAALAPFKAVRSWSDCYAHIMVATGRAEAAVDAPMQLWDVAALAPIITEAGGTFTDWQGQPTDGSQGAISTNTHLWPHLQPLLA